MPKRADPENELRLVDFLQPDARGFMSWPEGLKRRNHLRDNAERRQDQEGDEDWHDEPTKETCQDIEAKIF